MQDCHSIMICNAMIIHCPRNTIGKSIDPTDWLDFVGTPRGRSRPSTAFPNDGSIIFIMSSNLCGVCKYTISHLTNNNGCTFVEFIRWDNIICVTNATFIHPEDHALYSCLPYIRLAVNIYVRIFTHSLIQYENENFPWLRDCYSNNKLSIWVVIRSLEISSMPTQSPQGKYDFVRHDPSWRLVPRYLAIFVSSLCHESVSNDNLFAHGHCSPGWSIDFHR